MNWKIEDGLLWLNRDGEWHLQRCPYSSKFCGFECPLLEVRDDSIRVCNGNLYFNEVEHV